jgi:GntR family transcriptional regulator
MPETPDFQPLYRQVREVFLRRIVQRVWSPGEALPSEMALASELGVSQGTVRKALDSLAAEDLVERHQGRGTFIAEVTPSRSLFKFFRISKPGGGRVTPEIRQASAKLRSATHRETEVLKIAAKDKVVEIRSARRIEGHPDISEIIVVPAALFPGLESRPIPDELYTYYHGGYGVSVHSTDEELRAVSAGDDDAETLGVVPGEPLLEIERVAYDINSMPIEWRRTLCVSRRLVYAVTLR